MRYRDAGVDVPAGEAVKRALGESVRRTWGDAVHPIPGGFAGVMRWSQGDRWLAATMDGVGTKLHLALEAGRVGDACADLVFHCADDLLAHGARPIAFLDYIAQGRIEPEVVEAAVRGMALACGRVGAALLGGETAQMPDTYLSGALDVAGCMIGEVDPRRLRDGRDVRPGDVLVGLGSDGLHTNGFSLARRVLKASGLALDATLPGGGGESVGQALLAPHRWYGKAIGPWLEEGGLHALAHVTGGGIAGNLVRVLPEGCRAVLEEGSWPRPPLFRWLEDAGQVPEEDLRQTFNLGVGFVLACDPATASRARAGLERAGERAWVIGHVEAGERGVAWPEAAG